MKKILILLFFVLIDIVSVFSQEIPNGVTYIRKNDQINNNAIENINDLLFEQITDSIPSSIGCGPFFWAELVNNNIFSNSIGIPMDFLIPNGNSVQKLEGRVIRWEDQTLILLDILRRIISSSEEYTIREISSQEMQIYWMMIPYDIEEPIFMIEGPGLLLLIDCEENGDIFFIDNYFRILHAPN